MPGIENLAPERTETSKRIVGVAELATHRLLELEHVVGDLVVETRRPTALHVRPAGIGRHREPGRHRKVAAPWSSRRGWRPCRPADPCRSSGACGACDRRRRRIASAFESTDSLADAPVTGPYTHVQSERCSGCSGSTSRSGSASSCSSPWSPSSTQARSGIWLGGSLAVFTLLHELGHAVAARSAGADAAISLDFMAGYTSFRPRRPISKPRLALISVSGPAIQIVISLAVLAAMGVNPVSYDSVRQSDATLAIWWAGPVIGLLNLIPVLPLDGGHLAQIGLEGALRRPALREMAIVSLVDHPRRRARHRRARPHRLRDLRRLPADQPVAAAHRHVTETSSCCQPAVDLGHRRGVVAAWVAPVTVAARLPGGRRRRHQPRPTRHRRGSGRAHAGQRTRLVSSHRCAARGVAGSRRHLALRSPGRQRLQRDGAGADHAGDRRCQASRRVRRRGLRPTSHATAGHGGRASRSAHGRSGQRPALGASCRRRQRRARRPTNGRRSPTCSTMRQSSLR